MKATEMVGGDQTVGAPHWLNWAVVPDDRRQPWNVKVKRHAQGTNGALMAAQWRVKDLADNKGHVHCKNIRMNMAMNKAMNELERCKELLQLRMIDVFLLAESSRTMFPDERRQQVLVLQLFSETVHYQLWRQAKDSASIS